MLDVKVTLKPEKFEARLLKSRKYSQSIKVQWITTEGVLKSMDSKELSDDEKDLVEFTEQV